jgi:DNA-binding NarL/FixJ family response regulator
VVLAVREALRDKTYLSQILKEKVEHLRWEHKKMLKEEARLTKRQREVLQLLAEGKVMKEVGNILNMTTRTVVWHTTELWRCLARRTMPNWYATR